MWSHQYNFLPFPFEIVTSIFPFFANETPFPHPLQAKLEVVVPRGRTAAAGCSVVSGMLPPSCGGAGVVVDVDDEEEEAEEEGKSELTTFVCSLGYSSFNVL